MKIFWNWPNWQAGVRAENVNSQSDCMCQNGNQASTVRSFILDDSVCSKRAPHTLSEEKAWQPMRGTHPPKPNNLKKFPDLNLFAILFLPKRKWWSVIALPCLWVWRQKESFSHISLHPISLCGLPVRGICFWSQLSRNNFLSLECCASTTPVNIASQLLPMHRKCCCSDVDCTQCIESRYSCHCFL